MDFKKFCKQYATELGGEYREFDDRRSVIIVPLFGDRFQTITGQIVSSEDYSRELLQITTKVCNLKAFIPYEEILEASSHLPYAKFVTGDGFLKVEASSFLINLNEDMVKEMIQEVANVADDWEFRITGEDIH